MALIKPINLMRFTLKILSYMGISTGQNSSVIYRLYGFMVFVIFFGVHDMLLIGEVFSSKTFNEMVYSGACAIGMMVVGGRHLTLYLFSENVHLLTDEILEHFTNDETLFHNVSSTLRRFSIFATVFFGTVMTTVIGLFFLPLISTTKLLPYKIWFPFDYNRNIILLTSTRAYAIICMGMFAISALSTLFIWYLMLNVSLRYQTYGSQLRSLGNIQPDENVGADCKQLIEFIKLHLEILEVVGVIHRTFHNLFLFQLTTSGVGICCVLYVLVFASKGNFTEFVIYAVLLGYLIFEILAIMYFGNEITLTSSKLSYCLYESNWSDQSAEYKKLMFIFMAALSQPETIVIGKIFRLNLDMFMSIMRISYTSFNILRTFAE